MSSKISGSMYGWILHKTTRMTGYNPRKHHGFPWPVHWSECGDVLHGHGHEQYRLQQQKRCVHVPGGLLGTILVLYMEKFRRSYWANTMLPVLHWTAARRNWLSNPAGRAPQSSRRCLFDGFDTLHGFFFGLYACLTWVIPSEVFPTYLHSYGMTTSDANPFLCSFIVTYNFTQMMESMTPTGLTLGFYGGIAIIGSNPVIQSVLIRGLLSADDKNDKEDECS